MTRILPLLPTDLTKASTYDLLSYLNTRLAEQAEEYAEYEKELEPWLEQPWGMGAPRMPEFSPSYDEKLSDITTELLRRGDEGKL